MIEYELTNAEVKEIYTGWISDTNKVQDIARSDGRSFIEVKGDIVTGMIGEWGGCHHVQACHHGCNRPDCSVMKRDSSIWDKDLLLHDQLPILTSAGEKRVVDMSVTCKAQMLSQTRKVEEIPEDQKADNPSWTFQMPVEKGGFRFGDPLLVTPDANKLLIVSWINDYWPQGDYSRRPVYKGYPKTVYEQGFRWQPKVTCFWWPQVFGFLDQPRNPKLHGKKKVLYYADIKHLQVTVL